MHHELGPGFLEVIYQRALALELPAHEVDFNREVEIAIYYRGRRVEKQRVDYLTNDQTGSVMLEVKAKSAIEEVDFVQSLSYLKASGHKVGLLINFGGKKIEIRRLAN